jgi:hypothetical protein
MDYTIHQIRVEFKKLNWHEVYSYVEFILPQISNAEKRRLLIKELNKIFFEEGAPYKIHQGQVVQLMNEEEHQEISAAQEISTHINKAVRLFNQRPEPDYSNCIKESISAVESLTKRLLKNQDGTLGSLVDTLGLHPKLTEGIKNLYKWTSDEGGIRHGEKEGDKIPTEEDARLMMIICSGLTNYISAIKK